MSVSETVRGIVQESVESMALASGINGSNLQPRCRICRNDSLRTKVNDLLTTGASYAMVLRALGDDNATLEQRDRVTIVKALDRPYIVRSVSVSTPRGTFMKTSACMLVASVFRVMMSDKVVFFTMRTSAGSSAFSK